MKSNKQPPVSVELAPRETVAIIPRNPYSPYKKRSITDFGENLTKQSFKDECNINNIVSRYASTGVVTHINLRTPMYGDINVNDFSDALETLRNAEEEFMNLPAQIRDHFNHDPGQFLAFCHDPSSRPEMAALGLTVGAPLPPAPEPRSAPEPNI